MNDQQNELPEPTLPQVNITQVSNGFISEVSASSRPGQESQERARVHANVAELTAYIEELFAEAG